MPVAPSRYRAFQSNDKANLSGMRRNEVSYRPLFSSSDEMTIRPGIIGK